MTPRFSLIIPTLNEAQRLPATLAAAHRAFGDAAEYIVSDGGSSDATCDIAVRFGAYVIEGERGRGVQLQRGFCEAHADTCVFLHADTLVPASARSAVEKALSNHTVVGGAFSLEFAGSEQGGFLIRVLQHAINVRARLFRTATGDQVIFARRWVLQELGGVPSVPLFEDVRLCRALKRKGRFVILPQRVATSARLWQALGTGNGILLHLSLRVLHALGASPRFLARHYPSPR
jgi:rSAM/selenodomain-associated transferase 2